MVPVPGAGPWGARCPGHAPLSAAAWAPASFLPVARGQQLARKGPLPGSVGHGDETLKRSRIRTGFFPCAHIHGCESQGCGHTTPES